MSEKKLHNINSTGHKIPNNYFEGMESELMEKLASNNPLDAIAKTGFTMPKGYLNEFENKLIHNLSKQDTKVISIYRKRKFYYVIGIAASLILMVSLFMNRDHTVVFDELDVATMEDFILDESSSSDLASLFSEDDDIESLFNTTYYSDNELETYMLENITIEDLIEN